MKLILGVGAFFLSASSSVAFVPVAPAARRHAGVPSSSPLWGPRDGRIILKSAAGGSKEGPSAFDDDEKGWKDVESGFMPQKEYQLKSGIFRLPSLADFSSTLPPVSRLHKFKNFILRRKPIYQGLYHDDYVEACRSLGVPQDIEEGALNDKVQQLMVKYEKDRKKRIMVDWAHDKILEHRLFLQLDGGAEKPPGTDLNMLDERNYELSERDRLDFMSALDISPDDLRRMKKPGPLSWLFNNKLTRTLGIKKLLDQIFYVFAAMRESYEGPNLKRLVWPGAFCLGLAFWFGSTVDNVFLKYAINVITQFAPIYNRGEAALANRRERRPIKWRKVFLALSFMSIVSGAGYGLGKGWVALKYPTFEVETPQFILILTNFLTYFASASFFIRESTLAAGEGGKRKGGGGRRPA